MNPTIYGMPIVQQALLAGAAYEAPRRTEAHIVQAPNARLIVICQSTPAGLITETALIFGTPGSLSVAEARQRTAELCRQAGGLAWDVWRGRVAKGL